MLPLTLHAAVPPLLVALLEVVEQGPEPEDVKAGWMAFALFLGLGVAVALLGWSLTRQLRKAQAARDAGVYGDEPVDRTDTPRPVPDETPGDTEDPPRG